MRRRRVKNLSHSIFQQLLNRARKNGEDVNLLLIRYAMERFLYRLSISSYADQFILKGASLFLVWQGQNYRVTRDLDLLAISTSNLPQLERIFREICGISCHEDDGIHFITESVNAMPIREDQEYEGVRLTFRAQLHDAKIAMQIDIGFGDVITPEPERVSYPVLLAGSVPHLHAYPRYTMVSEKLEATVRLGMANSRMKDFYDILLLSRMFEFDSGVLLLAIRNTFIRRRTPLPAPTPLSLSDRFSTDEHKQKQWEAFIRKTRPVAAIGDFRDVVLELREFLLPVLNYIDEEEAPEMGWDPVRHWQKIM